MNDILTSSTRPGSRHHEMNDAVTLAIASFVECFEGLCQKIERALFNQAGSEADLLRQSCILYAYGLLRSRREEIRLSFRKALDQIVQRCLHDAPPSHQRQAYPLLDLEIDGVGKRMVRWLRRAEDAGTIQAINDLVDRFEFLLNLDGLSKDNNPFSPDAICIATRQAFEPIFEATWFNHDILHIFETQLGPAFSPAYQTVNAHLIKRNIIPNLAAYREQRRTGQRTLSKATPQATIDVPNLAPPSLLQSFARHYNRPVNTAAITELVGVFFEQMKEDHQVPEGTRAIIQRLQPLFTRMALADTGLFEHSEHPLRRLIDAMDEKLGESYYDLLDTVVTHLEAQTDHSPSSLQQEIERIRGFKERQLNAQQSHPKDATYLLRKIEQREIANAQVSAHLHEALEHIALHNDLRHFLLDPWKNVIVENRLSDANENALLLLHRTIIDLVWSVQPKTSDEEQKKLLDLLPPLFTRLRDGLEKIVWPKEKQNAFFVSLMEMHSNAVRTPKRTEHQEEAFRQFRQHIENFPVTADITAEALVFGLEQVTISPIQLAIAMANHQVKITVAMPPLANTSTLRGLSESEVAHALGHLSAGAPIHYKFAGETRRLKLSWVSDLRTLWLFTDHITHHNILFTNDVLRAHLHVGSASLLEHRSLTERALGAIEATLTALQSPA